MDGFETLIYEKSNNIAYITLNRPQVLNVCNIQMRDELYQVLSAIQDDPEVLVSIIRGAGEKAFCAGADLKGFLTAPSPTAARKARAARDIWRDFLSIPTPLIAALHGYVLGLGVEIALCCDIRVASEEAQFGLPELGLGIIPAGGATQTLPRHVGLGKSLEMILTGRRVSAKEAFDMGLVNRVVPRDRLLPVVEDMAQKIVSLDPVAIKAAKQAVTRSSDLSLAEGLELEKNLASLLRLSRANRRFER